MKLLFFSNDLSEVELASQALRQAGVPCQIRHSPEAKRRSERFPETELWITNAKHTNKAMTLCVQLGVGFSKRPPNAPVAESD
jgi:hypothetical protein